jgi:hypothetical protein
MAPGARSKNQRLEHAVERARREAREVAAQVGHGRLAEPGEFGQHASLALRQHGRAWGVDHCSATGGREVDSRGMSRWSLPVPTS